MIAAVTMVKNEADIIVASILAMAAQVDRVYVLDNGSTDGTRALLAQLPVVVDDEPEVGYYQSERMSMLARRAFEDGARWVVPFDADEVWASREPDKSLREVLRHADRAGYDVVCGALFDHVATGADPDDLSPLRRMGWRRRESVPLPKVAARARPDLVIAQGNHVARAQGPLSVLPGFPLMVRHFSNRSPEQFVAKIRVGAAAYAASDLPESMGTHWRTLGTLTDAELADHFAATMYVAEPAADESLVFDPLA